ncbi:MAG: ABC transporter substrate-binding protein/permease, partial [Tissierellia bacterium]|nr:ABC transporter substrate-binding protein/permease [Tissierellia bacterium]
MAVPAFAEGTDEQGVLKVGMEANYAPFNWSQTNDENGAYPIENSDGEYANGYDAYIAQKIADGLGMELQIIKTEWDGLAPGILSGKIDLIIAGMSPTAERKEQIDFTDKYYTSDLVVVVKKDSPYVEAKSIDDFQGAKITGQLNTFHYTVIDDMEGVEKATAMQDFPAMISATLAGKIDGYISERPGAMAAAASNEQLTFVAFEGDQGFDTSEEDTSIAVGLRKDSPLTEEINEILAGITDEERNQIMLDMVELNTQGEIQGFWQSTKGILDEFGPLFLKGAVNTMIIAILSTLIGFLIGIIVAIIRNVKTNRDKHFGKWLFYKILDIILVIYVEIFRGTPMMIQSLLIYYGGKLFLGLDMSAMTAALFIVSINTGAYLSEVVRGGINSIDGGQLEACKAIGMTHSQSMKYVILPQAIKNILPTIGNEFVINIKDTSVLNVISVTELFFISRSVAGSTYLIFQSYFIAGLIYFLLTFVTTRILLAYEKRSGKKGHVLTS